MIAEASVETLVAPGVVRRTDRGLCVAGTRISLYLLMDYLKAGWPPHLIRHELRLSEVEINQAINYIETQRSEFQAEYDQVVKKTEERESFYRAHTRKLQAKAVIPPLTPDQAVALARLQALKRAGKY